MLHRAILGSLDRFMAYLIEETKGRFPTWLAPTQVKVLPVSEKTLDYARTVADKLTAAGVRVVLDESNEKIGYKIREAQQVDRVPYMLVLGAKEAEAGNISVRDRKGETTTQELDAFINNIVTEIKEVPPSFTAPDCFQSGAVLVSGPQIVHHQGCLPF